MESTSQSSFISSISRLHNRVLGLPFFFPLLLPPFSKVARTTIVGFDDVPFLSDLEVDRSRTSPKITTAEVDWGARKLAIIVDFFSLPR